MRVYLTGHDGIGWSIDQDRTHAARFLIDLGHTLTPSPFAADVVHSLWWNQLLKLRYALLRRKRCVITTATNRIDPEDEAFARARRFVSVWVAPSRRQLAALEACGVHAVYQPFYVDERRFTRLHSSRQGLALDLGIDARAVEGKFLIGSFQRDTLAGDLASPKWQKGPDLLVEMLSRLPHRSRWMLLLAGPRRHYLLRECKRRGIPHLYVGRRPNDGQDDLLSNNLPAGAMVKLYNLVDCYLVTSRSEGGPKAVLEASFCRTPILSTPVGLAPDVLCDDALFEGADEAVKHLSRAVEDGGAGLRKLAEVNYERAVTGFSYPVAKERWRQIYESL